MPKAAGKSNVYEISAKGTRLVLVLNGVKTVDVQDSKLASARSRSSGAGHDQVPQGRDQAALTTMTLNAVAPLPLDAATLRALSGVTTATLTTVLLEKGLRNVWIRGARPLAERLPERRVGRAFTLRFVPAREDLATPASWASPISTRAAIEAMPAGCDRRRRRDRHERRRHLRRHPVRAHEEARTSPRSSPTASFATSPACSAPACRSGARAPRRRPRSPG